MNELYNEILKWVLKDFFNRCPEHGTYLVPKRYHILFKALHIYITFLCMCKTIYIFFNSKFPFFKYIHNKKPSHTVILIYFIKIPEYIGSWKQFIKLHNTYEQLFVFTISLHDKCHHKIIIVNIIHYLFLLAWIYNANGLYSIGLNVYFRLGIIVIQ